MGQQQDDKRDAQREIIRQSLNEIANDIGMAMRDVGLNFDLALNVPHSGNSLVTMISSTDPSDEDWEKVSAIVRKIVSTKLGGIHVSNRNLPFTMVNATTV